jgi:hypothetical protein
MACTQHRTKGLISCIQPTDLDSLFICGFLYHHGSYHDLRLNISSPYAPSQTHLVTPPNSSLYIFFSPQRLPNHSIIQPTHLLRHMLERLGQVFLAEGQLADGPDLGVLSPPPLC